LATFGASFSWTFLKSPATSNLNMKSFSPILTNFNESMKRSVFLTEDLFCRQWVQCLLQTKPGHHSTGSRYCWLWFWKKCSSCLFSEVHIREEVRCCMESNSVSNLLREPIYVHREACVFSFPSWMYELLWLIHATRLC
jgi:hypothetical protein